MQRHSGAVPLWVQSLLVWKWVTNGLFPFLPLLKGKKRSTGNELTFCVSNVVHLWNGESLHAISKVLSCLYWAITGDLSLRHLFTLFMFCGVSSVSPFLVFNHILCFYYPNTYLPCSQTLLCEPRWLTVLLCGVDRSMILSILTIFPNPLTGTGPAP